MELEEFASPVQLNINHKQACFTASDETHNWHEETQFTGVIIAGIKQRIMWPPFETSREGSRRPMCKSNNNEHGFPTAAFPWDDERASKGGAAEVFRSAITNQINCNECKFRINPAANKRNGLPVCESKYKLVLLDEQGKIVIMDASGAAKRVIAHYGQWFENQKMPTFCYQTKFTLQPVKNNGARYADLEVVKAAPTDRMRWVNEYLPLFKQWKEELEVPPSVSIGISRPELTTLDM